MTTATHKCVSCKEWYPVEQMKTFPCGSVCSDSCMMDLINKDRLKRQKQARIAQDRAKKKRDKQISKDLRDLNRRTLSWQHKQTKTAFNRMRVLLEKLRFEERGLEPECISCGKTNMDWCCGHYSSVASHGEHRYNPINTYLQCNARCNSHLSANKSGDKTTRGYDQGLIDRFGEDEAHRIIEWCTASMINIWT